MTVDSYKKIDMNQEMFAKYAKNNDRTAMKIMFNEGYVTDEEVFTRAATEWDTSFMEWLLDNDPILKEQLALKEESRHYDLRGYKFYGHMDNLKWFIKHGVNLVHFKSLFRDVAKYGTIEDLEWIKKNGANLEDDYIMDSVSTMGDMKNLKWCYANDCSVTTGCYVSLIKALSDESTKEMARININWLIEHDKDKVYKSGHLFTEVAKNNDLFGIKWLKTRQCEHNENILECYSNLVRFEKIKYDSSVVEYIHKELYVKLDDLLIPGIILVNEKEFKQYKKNMIWLSKNDCPLSNGYKSKYGEIVKQFKNSKI